MGDSRVLVAQTVVSDGAGDALSVSRAKVDSLHDCPLMSRSPVISKLGINLLLEVPVRMIAVSCLSSSMRDAMSFRYSRDSLGKLSTLTAM